MSFLSNLIGWTRFGCQLAFGFFGIILGALYVFQNKLLYMPNPPGFPTNPDVNPDGWRSPADWSIKGRQIADNDGSSEIPYEDEMLETPDHEKIHIWLMLQPKHLSNKVPTLLYFHGNAGNMGFRLQNAAQMYALCGINVLMMDYRGYGKSTGSPTEEGLKIDAATVLRYALKHPRLRGSPIVAFGRSLGGAVSVQLAQQFPEDVNAIILENTFLSISAMVDKLMPQVAFLKFLVLRIGWNSDKSISSLKQPILFISGDSDELVPPFHMKKLFELSTSSKLRDFFNVSGGTHNDTWNKAGRGYYQRMKEFLLKVTDPSGTGGSADSDDSDHAQCSSAGALPTMTASFRVQ